MKKIMDKKRKYIRNSVVRNPKRVSFNKAVKLLTASATNMFKNYCMYDTYYRRMQQGTVAEIIKWDHKDPYWTKLVVVHGNGDWSQTSFGQIIGVDTRGRLYEIYDTNHLYTRRWRWSDETYDLDMFMWTDGYSCEENRWESLYVWHTDRCDRTIVKLTRSKIKQFLNVVL